METVQTFPAYTLRNTRHAPENRFFWPITILRRKVKRNQSTLIHFIFYLNSIISCEPIQYMCTLNTYISLVVSRIEIHRKYPQRKRCIEQQNDSFQLNNFEFIAAV